jgi:hypothetical protein
MARLKSSLRFCLPVVVVTAAIVALSYLYWALLASRLPSGIQFGAVALPARWVVYIVLGMGTVALAGPVERAVRKWLADRGWCDRDEAPKETL